MPPSRVRIPPSPLRSTERCPSGLRSATGNRVRAERCVAGSNPALSVTRGGTHVSPTIPLLRVRRRCERYGVSAVTPPRSLSVSGLIEERKRGARSTSAKPASPRVPFEAALLPWRLRSCGVGRRRRALGTNRVVGKGHYAAGTSFGYMEVLERLGSGKLIAEGEPLPGLHRPTGRRPGFGIRRDRDVPLRRQTGRFVPVPLRVRRGVAARARRRGRRPYPWG